MKKYIPFLGFVLMLSWMLVIFLFSSKTGNQVESEKGFIVDSMVDVFEGNKFEEYPAEVQQQVKSEYSFYVSKIAHFMEYGILCFFAFLTFIRLKKYNLRYIIGISICTIYAITDELHQMVSSGRTPRALDVAIDSLGALTAVLVIELFITVVGIVRKCKAYD